jgi:hypothetical protein
VLRGALIFVGGLETVTPQRLKKTVDLTPGIVTGVGRYVMSGRAVEYLQKALAQPLGGIGKILTCLRLSLGLFKFGNEGGAFLGGEVRQFFERHDRHHDRVAIVGRFYYCFRQARTG